MEAEGFWLLPAVAATVAAGFDLRSRRIPNKLTYTLFVVGIAAAFMLGSIETALVSISLCILPGVLGFLLNILGGGDVKLLAALGAWLVPEQAMWLMLLTICLGGGFGACLWLYLRLSPCFQRLAEPAVAVKDDPLKHRQTDPRSEVALPLGVPICLAFWLVATGVLP